MRYCFNFNCHCSIFIPLVFLWAQKYAHPEVEASICNTRLLAKKEKAQLCFTLQNSFYQVLSSWTQPSAMENAEFCYRAVWSPTLSASSVTLPAETETAYKWSLPQINLYPLHKKRAGHFVVKFPVHGMTSLLMTWGSHTAYTDMEKPMRTGDTFSVEEFGLEALLWIWRSFQHPPNTCLS